MRLGLRASGDESFAWLPAGCSRIAQACVKVWAKPQAAPLSSSASAGAESSTATPMPGAAGFATSAPVVGACVPQARAMMVTCTGVLSKMAPRATSWTT